MKDGKAFISMRAGGISMVIMAGRRFILIEEKLILTEPEPF